MEEEEEMGQSNSKRSSSLSKPYSGPECAATRRTLLGVRVEKIDVRIENKPTLVNEKSKSVLKYKTPYFKATASVKFPPVNTDQVWKIGWIQACTHMKFHNHYGEFGYSSWEFPELDSGEKHMVSDSDGTNFPWYGSKTEVADVVGPQDNPTLHHVSMNDNFHPHITWDIPTSGSSANRLTRVTREQKFLTWLVAMEVVRGEFFVLKTYRWGMHVEIAVDPSKKLGQRARVVSEQCPRQPYLLKKNVRVPSCALYPSNANSSQILVWYPRSQKSRRQLILGPNGLKSVSCD